jgi:hypothetical protein
MDNYFEISFRSPRADINEIRNFLSENERVDFKGCARDPSHDVEEIHEEHAVRDFHATGRLYDP